MVDDPELSMRFGLFSFFRPWSSSKPRPRADLRVDVAVQIVKHEAHVAIDVPVHACGVDGASRQSGSLSGRSERRLRRVHGIF